VLSWVSLLHKCAHKGVIAYGELGEHYYKSNRADEFALGVQWLIKASNAEFRSDEYFIRKLTDMRDNHPSLFLKLLLPEYKHIALELLKLFSSFDETLIVETLEEDIAVAAIHLGDLEILDVLFSMMGDPFINIGDSPDACEYAEKHCTNVDVVQFLQTLFAFQYAYEFGFCFEEVEDGEQHCIEKLDRIISINPTLLNHGRRDRGQSLQHLVASGANRRLFDRQRR
jgi:hypothetical protein